jgi:hypothetical protein
MGDGHRLQRTRHQLQRQKNRVELLVVLHRTLSTTLGAEEVLDIFLYRMGYRRDKGTREEYARHYLWLMMVSANL